MVTVGVPTGMRGAFIDPTMRAVVVDDLTTGQGLRYLCPEEGLKSVLIPPTRTEPEDTTESQCHQRLRCSVRCLARLLLAGSLAYEVSTW